jgi:multiple sugar transport system permease protein
MTGEVRQSSRPRRDAVRNLKRAAFFIPAVSLLVFLVIYPVAQTVYISFLSRSGEFVGLDNYGAVLRDRDTLDLSDTRIPYGTLINNAIWISIHLPLSLFTGLFLALTLQKVRGAAVVKSMIFLGMVTPLVVGGIILRFLFDERSGIVPVGLGLLGIDSLAIQWMAFPHTLLFGLIFGSVWLWTGFSMIVYSAGVTTIPKDYFEAAVIDGASSWRTFRKITWPLLRPITLVVVTMTLLWELKLFDLVIAAADTSGGVSGAADVLALQMFRYGFVSIPRQYNEAAVVATLLTFLTLLIAGALFRRILLGQPKKGRFRFLLSLWGVRHEA